MAKLRTPVTSRDHIQGLEDAPLTLVEYGDYECPSCGSAYPIVKRVQEQFGRRLRFIFRNFPLSEIHPHAESAAETAEFAAAQQRFWEMHDLLFENQEQMSEALF
jgi:protein-disulfide isomerase